MNEIYLVLPILAHVVLVIALYIVLAVRKAAAVRAGGVDLKRTALDNKAWPEAVVKVSNNIDNNFESPMLFYGVCLVSAVLGVANSFAIACSIGYVMVRYAHSFVHIRSNYVPLRLRLFVLSLLMILALLVNVLVHLL